MTERTSEDRHECDKCEGTGIVEDGEDGVHWDIGCDKCDGNGWVVITQEPHS